MVLRALPHAGQAREGGGVTEQFSHWITTDFSYWEAPTVKTLRRRLTKLAKTAPPEAKLTLEKKDSPNGNGKHYTQLAAHWYEWR